jgi:DNA repair exonuclease SbcCD ATPase subunit
MNNKIKILLISLASLCALALIIAFQLNAVNKSLRAQFSLKESEFQNEKQSLNQQLASTLEAKKKLDAQLADLRGKFDVLTKEHEGVKGKFDLVTKERATLVEKVQDLAKQKKELELEVAGLKKSGATMEDTQAVAAPAPGASAADDAYWANILREKAALEIQVKNLTTQLSDAQLKVGKAMEEGRKLELEIKTLSETKGDLERRITYNEKLAETLSEDLVREKRDKKAIAEQAMNLRTENFELKARLMALGDKKTSLETRLVDLQQEREVLSKRLSELDSILQDRVDQIIQVKDDIKNVRAQAKEASAKDSRVVQLQPIVVKAQEGGSSGKKLPAAGQVLALNEENNFVITDLGEDDGVKVGQTFSIYRGTQKIASVEVIQTRKEISAADIKNVNSGAKIKIGDMVS